MLAITVIQPADESRGGDTLIPPSQHKLHTQMENISFLFKNPMRDQPARWPSVLVVSLSPSIGSAGRLVGGSGATRTRETCTVSLIVTTQLLNLLSDWTGVTGVTAPSGTRSVCDRSDQAVLIRFSAPHLLRLHPSHSVTPTVGFTNC